MIELKDLSTELVEILDSDLKSICGGAFNSGTVNINIPGLGSLKNGVLVPSFITANSNPPNVNLGIDFSGGGILQVGLTVD